MYLFSFTVSYNLYCYKQLFFQVKDSTVLLLYLGVNFHPFDVKEVVNITLPKPS